MPKKKEKTGLRWFKVWTSVLSDDDFDTSRAGGLEGLGRWVILGAYTALHGQNGRVEIMPDTLLRMLKIGTIEELYVQLWGKNIVFEEGINRHGKVTVTWLKWRKYQQDSTEAERARASRSKRRGEERREEETRQEKIVPPISPTKNFTKPTLEEIKTRIQELGFSVDAVKFYAHYESNGWRVGKNPMKNWKAALVTWSKNDYPTGGTPNGTRNADKPIVGDAAPVPGKYAHLDRLVGDSRDNEKPVGKS